ncbi:MAG TPA: ATP-dependent metallopeptidase FtsH/Yme1/Tma family protein, partial [Chloroflexota bacterium]|nr:ATP-dependent metallopeptidase FtsH/Yme1/Tma family protein [Chloroflexota bacterium]
MAPRNTAQPRGAKNGANNRNGSDGNPPPAWLRSSNPGPGPSANQQPPRRAWWANLWWIGLVAVIAYNVFSLINTRSNVNPLINVPYSTFLGQLNDQNVASVSFQGTDITGKFKHAITFNPADNSVSTPGASASASASPSPSASASGS